MLWWTIFAYLSLLFICVAASVWHMSFSLLFSGHWRTPSRGCGINGAPWGSLQAHLSQLEAFNHSLYLNGIDKCSVRERRAGLLNGHSEALLNFDLPQFVSLWNTSCNPSRPTRIPCDCFSLGIAVLYRFTHPVLNLFFACMGFFNAFVLCHSSICLILYVYTKWLTANLQLVLLQ